MVQRRCSENWRRDTSKEAVTGFDDRLGTENAGKEGVRVGLGWGRRVWSPVLLHLPVSCSSPQAGEVGT